MRFLGLKTPNKRKKLVAISMSVILRWRKFHISRQHSANAHRDFLKYLCL